MKSFLLAFSLLVGSVYISTAQQAMGPWSNTGPINFPINVSGQVDGIGRVSQIKFHPTNNQKIYAVSASGGLYISSNNGQTWAPTIGTETLPATSCSAVCVDYTNDQIIYLCLGDANYYSNNYGIYKSTDGGITWNASNSGIGANMAVEILMDPANHNNIVAATKGGIWKTTNAGASWTLKASGQFRDMKAAPASSTKLYAATATQFFVSNDFGDTWTQITSGIVVPSGNGGMRIAVSAADPSRVYLATTGSNGVIMRSANGGTSFTTTYSSSSQCLVCYDANPSSGSQGDYNLDLTCNPQNANEVILIAHNVWRSTDGGVNWSKRTSWYNEVHTDMHHIEFNPYNNAQLFNANDGGVWLSTDTLATAWSPRSDGLAATEIYHAAQSPQVRQMVSIGTQDNGELYFSNNWKCNRGGDWSAKCRFDYATPATVYYLGNGKRRNLLPLGGEQTYNCPFDPTNNATLEFLPSMTNVAFIAKDSIWCSTNINTSNPIWSLIRSATETIRDIASCRADSNILYYVTSAGHIFRSDNALATAPVFTQLNTPGSTSATASITTNKNNANVVFLSCNAGIYRSADKGVTWTNITGTGLSGANIRKIIHDDNSTNERLFVNAANFVHYKDNTTASWTNHSTNQGLPSVCNVTDMMIYNPGNASSILRLSTYGRGVWECDINDNLPPFVDFIADKQQVCPGDTVRFYKTVYGNATSFSWTFPGGTPATSTLDSPVVVYNTVDTVDVTLTAASPGGTTANTKTAYIRITNGQTTPLAEGFEGATYPPANWQLLSNSGNAWQQTSTVGGFGASAHAITFDNYDNDAGGMHDIIFTPTVDLTGTTKARLTFDVAYAPYSSAYPDSLMVQISTDCGKHYIPIYIKSGNTLATAPAYTSSTFVPTAAQWRKDTISLNSYTGGSIKLSFENIGYYGQAIYLDNINIERSPSADFYTNDTATCINNVVHFIDSSTNATSLLWSFPGGTPSSSTQQQPSVTYASAGFYSVTLKAINGYGVDTEVKTSYINVHPLPTVSIVNTNNILTTTGTSGTYQWYLNGNLISGATNNSYQPTQAGNYTVNVADAAGCSATSVAYTYLSVNNVKSGATKIYPNPTSGILNISVAELHGASAIIRCYNAAGVMVKEMTTAIINSKLQCQLNLETLPRGIYSLRISSNEGQQIRQNIVLK
ncbi:PKD domain-containing protein [Taibaiella soli]|nr:PKD domain-containing protein [Taibaiella soli]